MLTPLLSILWKLDICSLNTPLKLYIRPLMNKIFKILENLARRRGGKLAINPNIPQIDPLAISEKGAAPMNNTIEIQFSERFFERYDSVIQKN
jgi:hypothetical protein